MAKLFCTYCLKKEKKTILTFQLRYLKNKKWIKPEKSHYCENCKKTYTRQQCTEDHFYNTEYGKKGVN